ncbi:MAG: terminase [Terriglobales bacterium]
MRSGRCYADKGTRSNGGIIENPKEDLAVLEALGAELDVVLEQHQGSSLRDWLAGRLLHIRDKSGRLVPLRGNRAQREFSRHCGSRNIVLKARQMGITTWVAARFFLATITRRGTLSVLVAHDKRSAEEIFRIVRRFWENLPKTLRCGALRTSHANVRQMVFPELDSEYRVETAADPEAGRGLTIQNLHASEVARWPRDAAATLASLRAAVAPEGEIVLESTPNGSSGCYYREWQSAAETGTARHFLPWWWTEEYRRAGGVPGELSEEEQGLVTQHQLSGEQIVFRRELRANFRGFAKQEFAEDAESCFLASGECFFEKDLIEARLRDVSETREEWDARPPPWIFLPPQAGREYIVGVDPAEGGSEGDYAVAQVVDRVIGMQCAELSGHFPPHEMARRVTALARQYNGALVAVERNGVGGTTLAYLNDSEHYENLFFRDGKLGFPTNSQTRPAMVDTLAACFAVHPGLLHSPRLLREMRSFVRQKTGRPGAGSGTHDDCVMAMALALKVREETHGAGKLPATLEMGSLEVPVRIS